MSLLGDSLGDRMKVYENGLNPVLTDKLPIIVRLDGKAFHTYTRGLQKPFDQRLIDVMDNTTTYLCKTIQDVAFAYTQSDEISLCLVNYSSPNSQPWFGNNLQKIVSVTAGTASAYFTECSTDIFGKPKLAVFDSRAFVLPKYDVQDYFFWRQTDCIRNSISGLAQSLFSHKELEGLNQGLQKQKCRDEAGVDWEKQPDGFKYGRFFFPESEMKECVVNNKSVFVARNLWKFKAKPVRELYERIRSEVGVLP